MKKRLIIDLQEESNDIDILNISWSDYSNIMISLDEMIKQLEKIIGDNYLDPHREQLLKKYKDLFLKMKSTECPWRGQAVSLDDNVIEATKKN
jgi:hypothetical protein